MWRPVGTALAVIAVHAPAIAGDKVQYAAAPEWVNVAPMPDAAKLAANSFPLVLSDQQQRMADGQVWLYSDTAVRVSNNQLLTQFGTVALPWAPDQGDLIVHRVEIIRDGQSIDLLGKADRFTILRREGALEQLSMTGILTATMAVEGLRINDILRVSISVTRRDQALAGGMQAFLPLLPAEVKPVFARARLLWPKAETIQWRSLANDARTTLASVKGDQELLIALPLPKAPELPDDAPARFNPIPVVEATTFKDWSAVSSVMAPLYRHRGLIADGSPLAAEVDAIAAAHKGDRARAAAALQVVQDKVRYLFSGMDGGNYRPQTPAQTWQVRYGDCKAKTLLLLAMLDRLGIQGEAVLASSELGDAIPKRLPTPGAFNHVLVRAEVGGDALWLDGTMTGSRLADIANVPPFRHVLPIREQGAALLELTMRADARPLVEGNIAIDTSAGVDIPAPYVGTFVFRGPPSEILDTAKRQATDDQLRGLASAAVGDIINAGAIISQKIDRDDAAGATTLTVRGITSTPWRRNDELRRFVYEPNGAVSRIEFAPDRARPAWRDIPVKRAGLSSAVTKVTMRLPDGGRGFAIDGDAALPERLAGFAVSRSAKITDGGLIVAESAFIDTAEIAPTAVASERAAVTRMRDRQLRVLAPADTPIRAFVSDEKPGRYKALTEAFRDLVAAYPDEAESYSNRANFFSGIYDFRGALPDYDKAISIEPSSGLLRTRGGVHEELGNDAKALADYRQALEIAPDDIGALASATRLMARTGKVDEAVAMLDDRGSGLDLTQREAMRADIFAMAGRKEDAAAARERSFAAKPVNADSLNERCWMRATLNIEIAGALKDCTRGIELAQYPAAILDSRALVYFRMGRMEEALDDLRAALDAAPGQAASLYLRGVIRKRQGDPAAAADLAAARRISPTIDRTYQRYGVTP